MAQSAPETLNMDQNLSFRKNNHITISRKVAFGILAIFVILLLAVGLVTYFLSVHSNGSDDDQSTTERPQEQSQKYLRLPRSLAPESYDLKIITFMDNFTFSGSVNITGKVVESCRNVTLHALNLNVTKSSVRVMDANNAKVAVADCTMDKSLQFFVVHLDGMLPVGGFSVSMEFQGVLNDDLAGFYRSSYKVRNETKWLAATQFEATDARQAFPCFDEPHLKATFKLTLGRSKELNSISNMPRISTIEATEYPGFQWDEFQKSVPMSTYVVAFLVSDFTSDAIDNFSLWARKSAINQTKTALELGPKFLKYYEQYFDVPFPLPKIDMAAIPDFPAGAMENWGLITYRENTLLYDEGISTKRDLAHIATVIAHELGHQWFGNLVTMKWWSDLWLNEGFASYVENIATDHVFPDWGVMDLFVINYLHAVFDLDGLESSHPISVVVNDPSEIEDIFDRISYLKGASIIRMMESFLTTPVFQKGITKYLNDMKYKSAEQDDLWACLTFAARNGNKMNDTISVKEAMDPWTLQTGYPIVSVARADNKITFTQQRFLQNTNKTNSEVLWGIPLSYTDKKKENVGTKWMSKTSKTMPLDLSGSFSSNDWFLLNVNQTGYYRVKYDNLGWKLIIAELKSDHKLFDVRNRAQFLDDSFSLAAAGYLEYDFPLNISMYLVNEKEYVPWNAAFNNLDFLMEMFLRSGHFDKFKAYFMHLLENIFNTVGMEESKQDTLQKTYLRDEVLTRACKLGHTKCISKAVADFRSWMAAADPDINNPILSNSKSYIYCTAVELLGIEAWNFVWERYQKTNVATEKSRLLNALGCSQQPWIIYKFMALALQENSGIRKQDVAAVFSALGRNIMGQTLGFRFVIGNWKQINDYLGKTIITTSGILRAVTKNMNTEKELEELVAFTESHKNDTTITQRSVQQIVEQTKANIDWTKTHFKTILNWISKQNLK